MKKYLVKFDFTTINRSQAKKLSGSIDITTSDPVSVWEKSQELLDLITECMQIKTKKAVVLVTVTNISEI